MIKSQEKPLLCITGPTSSGKSALGIKLAKTWNADIVNIDSVQAYKGFDIGSGKVSEEEMEGVKHHLLDCYEPQEQINASLYGKACIDSINKIHSQNKQAIIVSGTNLYLKSFLEGFADLPAANQEYRLLLDSISTEDLHEKLQKIDSNSAESISSSDRLRIVRALEVWHEIGEKQSIQFSRQASSPRLALILVLCWKRDKLYDRINKRVDSMINQGIVEETRKLINSYSDNMPALRSLGYAQVKDFLDSKVEEDLLANLIAQQTRRFAKRQMTFWRNEPKKSLWEVRPVEAEESIYIGNETPIKSKNIKTSGFRVYNKTFQELESDIVERFSSLFDKTEVWYLNAEILFS